MYTRCPTCSTCFRVTDRHLAIAKGKVRCGQCQLVFNALEHAIDDLPAKQTSPKPVTTKPEIKKTIKPAAAPKIDTRPPVEPSIKAEKTIKPVKSIPPKEPVTKKPEAKPVFDADETMIAGTAAINNADIDNIKLDLPTSNPEDISIIDEDDIFDDSFDLNAAIDELTQATDEINDSENKITEDSESEIDSTENYTPTDNNHGDVFTTDAYDATNASSVSEILNEMEGQLSLDISEPEIEKEYDANDEFEFLELNDDIKSTENLAEEEQNKAEPYSLENAKLVDEDKLFDQVDLSDFHDSDVEDNIVIENDQQQNIGQHAPENDVPFQLRNDIKSLQATSLHRWHPLLSAFSIIILLVLSFSQIAYFRAHELVSLIPASRPFLESFCEKVNCHYSGPRDTKQIQLIRRDVRLHPKEKKALLISAAMINNAYFAQPYPDIHIRLSDISGNVIAERVFNSKTYMGKLSNPFLLMKPKTPVHINFEVVDPGKDAINFEFTFL